MIAFAVKLTLLLAAGLIGTALLRSRAASLRHFVWMITLAGTLALGAAVAVVPTLAIPVPGLAAPTITPFADAVPIGSTDAGAIIEPVATRERIVDYADATARRVAGMESVLVAVWLAGAAAVLAWWLLGHAGLERLVSRAVPVTAGAWNALLAEVASAGGVRQRVELRYSADVGSPVVWGVHRPVILLPSDADTWSSDRRRAVLAHELAHVARRDGTVNGLAFAAVALYWFHPLAWFGMHRLRIESERACDDRVLRQGTRGADYAVHLMEVARSARALRLGGVSAIAMARASHLEGRLLAVLDESCPRSEPRTLARTIVGLAFALGVPLLAAARAVPWTAADTTLRLAEAAPSSGSLIERTLDAADGERLRLDLETGASIDLRGWDEPRVRIRLQLSGRNQADTRVDIERVADGVRVHTWIESDDQIQSTSHDLEIMVPRQYDLELDSAGGDVSLSDVRGRFLGKTGGGELTMARVNGEADLRTGGGDIQVTDADLRGSVRTGGGKVEFTNVAGGLRGSSGSGPVVYHDEGTDDDGGGKTSGRLHMSSAGGGIALDEVTDGADLKTGGGDIDVARARGYVTAKTGGGDIDIGHVTGGVRANTGAGTIRISVDELQSDGLTLGSGKGDIVIEMPADVAATFDLETAYTDNYGGKTRIDSDWLLEQSETDTWDEGRGTPRKYVRARGEAGAGGPRIEVRTVNGDISIRRSGASP